MKNIFLCFGSLHNAPMDLHEMITYITNKQKHYTVSDYIKRFVFASWKITFKNNKTNNYDIVKFVALILKQCGCQLE